MSEIIDIKTIDISKLELGSVPKPEPVIVVVEVPAPVPEVVNTPVVEPVVEAVSVAETTAAEPIVPAETTAEPPKVTITEFTPVIEEPKVEYFDPKPFPEVIVEGPTGPSGPPGPQKDVDYFEVPSEEPLNAHVVTGPTGATGPSGSEGFIISSSNNSTVTFTVPPVIEPAPQIATTSNETPPPKPIGDKVYTGTKWIFGAVCVVFILIFLAQFAFNLPHPKHWQFGAIGSNRGTVETVFVPVEAPIQTKIVESGRFLTAYQFPDGKIVKLTGGSVSWQLHNPGRLAFNKHSSSFGAFAKVKGYAAFPTYEQGHKALESMLFDDPAHGYRTLSIKDAIKKFNENDSDSAEYARIVGKALKLPLSTKLNELTEDQKRQFIDQIKTIEQFVPGRTWSYENIAEYKRLG